MTANDLKLLRDQIEHEDVLEKKLKTDGLNESEAREWRGATRYTEKELYCQRHDLLRLAEIGMESLKGEGIVSENKYSKAYQEQRKEMLQERNFESQKADLFAGKS